MYPHKALLRPLHPFAGKLPSIRTTVNSSPKTVGSFVSLRESPTVKKVVTVLSNGLRLCHRKNVEWVEPTPSHLTGWLEYTHEYLVSPILQLFRQLKAPGIAEDIHSHAEQDNDGTVKIRFTGPDFDTRKDPGHPPTVFITPQPFPNLVNTEAITRTVSPILGHTGSDSVSKTIFTDLETVLVIHPKTAEANQVEVEIIPLKDDLRAFRIIATAYLLEALPQFTYIDPPGAPDGKYVHWLPPRNYDEKLLTDEEVFQTKHRISDFNILKLLDDREGALQFFRWKLHLEKHVSPDITCAGDVLECMANEFDRQYHPPRGICSKPIPASTAEFMAKILRPNPLSSVLRSALNESKRFTIKLGRILGGPNRVGTRIHYCHIETVDGHPIENCPELVMKIYDDRFMQISNPYDEGDDEDEGEESDDDDFSPDVWFQPIRTAEWHVRGELTAYEKMEMAQGSLIPYFYGAHKFRLANGHGVFGILMERIDAPPLDSDIINNYSPERLDQLMTSIRQGLRVMQHCDVSQHDWHSGQILCNVPPSSPAQAHAVLIDFSFTTQTLDLNVDLSNDDYGDCISEIASLMTGLDAKRVFECWDRDEMRRECWDIEAMTISLEGYSWSSRGVDPYLFVYDS